MWLLAAETVESTLLDKGILGVCVLVLGWFSWITIKRLQRERDEALQRERASQEQIYTRFIPIVERLSAVGEARATLDKTILDVLTDVRRLLEQRKE